MAVATPAVMESVTEVVIENIEEAEPENDAVSNAGDNMVESHAIDDAVKDDHAIKEDHAKGTADDPLEVWISEQDANDAGNPSETENAELVDEANLPVKEEEAIEETKEESDPLKTDQPIVKVSGYLGKKGKLRMVSSWKKYWFVLEGRLLLYYRSKAEYDSLSPCKGSITLGSPCNIKPGSASNCVFQIETRNNTITLRAETRAEQDKWMLAILGALKQTQTSRMSHFRYSADDLALRTHADKPPVPALIRQHTMPDCNRAKSNGSKEKTMVERIEAIGGQSYTPKQKQLTEQMKANKASPKLPKNTNLKKLLDKQLSVVSANNDQGDWIKVEDTGEETVENDLYATFEQPKDRHIYQEIITDAHIEPEVIIDNSTYVDIDHNKNNVEYWEPIYDSTKPVYGGAVEPTLPPRPTLMKELSNEDKESNDDKEGGERVDKKKLNKLAKMVKEQRKEGTKRQSFVFRMFNKMKRNENSHESKSKAKAKNAQENTEMEKEVEEVAVVDLLETNAHDQGTDLSPAVIEELSEAIQAKENPDKTDDTEEENHLDDERVLLDECSGCSSRADTENTEPSSPKLEQLPQLEQPQLQLIQEQSDPNEILKPVESNGKLQETEMLKVSEFDYELYDPSQRLNIPRPKLICKPKRQKRQKPAPEVQSPRSRFNQQVADCDELRGQTVPHLNDDNKLMTIDEILDDLENHNYEPFSRQKVKELIEKFNDTEHDTDEDSKDEEQIHVHLRRKRIEQSEELNSLLDELSKVANAPVLTPDTSSLGDHGLLSEEEWKSIVPIRKRTLSDPDYDIPRPHSALQIIPSNEKEEARMQPTRFFGPVIIEQINGDRTSCGTSITPDSLEVDVLSFHAKNYTPSIEEDRSMRSYTSHIYASNESHLNNNNLNHNSHIHHKIEAVADGGVDPTKEEIYAKPKTLSPLIVPKADCEQAFYLSEKNDKNNNDTKVIKSDDARIFVNAICHTNVNISNSVCYDSLEPFTADSNE